MSRGIGARRISLCLCLALLPLALFYFNSVDMLLPLEAQSQLTKHLYSPSTRIVIVSGAGVGL